MQVKLCVKRGYQRLRGDMTLFFTGIIGQVMVSLREIISDIMSQEHSLFTLAIEAVR